MAHAPRPTALHFPSLELVFLGWEPVSDKGQHLPLHAKQARDNHTDVMKLLAGLQEGESLCEGSSLQCCP